MVKHVQLGKISKSDFDSCSECSFFEKIKKGNQKSFSFMVSLNFNDFLRFSFIL